MIYRTRTSFAAILRRARAERTLTSYDRQGECRTATVNWRWHLYQPTHGPAMDERDEAYERAAARYDGSGKDWR